MTSETLLARATQEIRVQTRIQVLDLLLRTDKYRADPKGAADEAIKVADKIMKGAK